MSFLPSRAVPALLLAAGLLAAPASSQSGRPDQVTYLSKNEPTQLSGTLVTATLDEVVLDVSGSERKFPSERVLKVTLGRVPAAFREATLLESSNDFENAAALFGNVASDSEESEVVRGYARLREAQALFSVGAGDPGAFQRAHDAAARLTQDLPTHRAVPEARMLAGRALYLAGNASGAADALDALYQEAAAGDPPAGYALDLVFGAGIEAARARIAAGDSAAGKQQLEAIEREIPKRVAVLEEDDPQSQRLGRLAELAQLGEGWALLADDKGTPARSFFQSLLDGAGPDQAFLRAGARLGLADALAAGGQHRRAQLEYARVTATAPDDDELVAQATLGLARAGVALGDPRAEETARGLAQSILTEFGRTTALVGARQLLDEL